MNEPLLFPQRGKYGDVKGPILFPGDLRRFLIALNPRLRVLGPIKENRGMFIASLVHWDQRYNEEKGCESRSMGNWRECCRVPVNVIPERSMFTRTGRVIHRGWREILALLERKRLIKIPKRYGGRHRILNLGNPVTILNLA